MPDISGSTQAYLAGQQANDTLLAFAKEETYAKIPKTDYQLVRFTSENFKPQETRARPDEINNLSEASQAVTTQVSVSGTLSGALSFGTYDAFLSAVLCGDWKSDILINDRIVKTFTFLEKIGDQYFIRKGSFCTRAQISLSQGNFSQISLDFSASNQETNTTSPATSLIPVNDNLVINTVNNFNGITLDDQSPTGCIKELQLTIERNGSGSDYGMGHADACGIRPGETLITGQLQIYFKNWDLYNKYAQNWSGKLEATITDDTNKGYILTLFNAHLINPVINAGSKNTSIVATFDIEANPRPGGGTMQIKRNQPTAPSPSQPAQTSSN